MTSHTITPRIALISATPAAIGPAVEGLAKEFPRSEVWNILDDRLLSDANSVGGLTPQLERRMLRLIEHAIGEGADGVLLTCSLYGAVTQQISAAIPVLAPDEAAFHAVVEGNFPRILVIASLEPALNDTIARLSHHIQLSGIDTHIAGIAVPGAFAPAAAGNVQELSSVLVAAILPQISRIDAVLLAQFSLAPAAEKLAVDLGIPVIAGPQTAAAALKRAIEDS